MELIDNFKEDVWMKVDPEHLTGACPNLAGAYLACDKQKNAYRHSVPNAYNYATFFLRTVSRAVSCYTRVKTNSMLYGKIRQHQFGETVLDSSFRSFLSETCCKFPKFAVTE